MLLRLSFLVFIVFLQACTTTSKDADKEKPLATSLTEDAQFDFALSLVKAQIEREEYKAAEQLLLKLRKEKEDIRVYRDLGRVYFLQQNMNLCYVSRQQVLDFKDYDINDEHLFAEVALKLGKYSEAEAIYLKWLKSEKKQTRVAGFNNLGFSNLLQKNFKQAEEYFLQTLALDPLNELARTNLELVLSLEGEDDEKVN